MSGADTRHRKLGRAPAHLANAVWSLTGGGLTIGGQIMLPPFGPNTSMQTHAAPAAMRRSASASSMRIAAASSAALEGQGWFRALRPVRVAGYEQATGRSRAITASGQERTQPERRPHSHRLAP